MSLIWLPDQPLEGADAPAKIDENARAKLDHVPRSQIFPLTTAKFAEQVFKTATLLLMSLTDREDSNRARGVRLGN